jgi:hypothetical protein
MENEKGRRAQAIASWVIAFFTIGLFAVAYLQYQLYKVSERPWIGPTTRSVGYDETRRSVVVVQWHYTNGGKSPAGNMRFNLDLKIGPPIPFQDLTTLKAPGVEECHSPQPLPGKDGFTAMPGTDQIFIATSTQNVLDSSDSVTKNLLGLYFVGCVDYGDVSGDNHRTNVCEFYVPASRTFLSCLHGNATD